MIAGKVTHMSSVLAPAFTTVSNGALTIGGLVVSPIGAAIAVLALCAAWLGAIEIELMDISGTKPRVGRH